MPCSRSHRFPAPLLITSLLIAACGGGGSEPVVPGAISVSPTDFALSAVGQTQQLTATVTDASGATIPSPSVLWSSSDRSVATVSGTGLVTAVGAGSAQITATARPVTANARVTVSLTAFNIELQFLTTPSAAQEEAFTAAKQRWQSLISGDLPDALLVADADSCGTNSPAFNRVVDDIVILVTLEPIDGPGFVLGQSFVCFVRVNGSLPVLGHMRFDTADLDVLEADNLLKPVILHEMGHELGFGTIWRERNLLVDPTFAGGTDPHFIGAQATAAFNAAGGANYTASAKVPVENTGTTGNKDGHWRESVFDNELMTPFVNQGTNPLSLVTLGSLSDLGYTVNPAGADPYTLPPGLSALARGRSVEMKDDILRLPFHVIDQSGRVVRTVQP